MRWKRASTTMLELALRGHPYPGVTADRRVTFSRSLGYVVVDDRLSATRSRTFRQLWHLRENAAPVTSGARTWTRAPRGNVLIVRVTAATTRTIKGATSPIQGWISYRTGKRLAAPVVESRRSGTRVRFLTLLVPFARTRPSVSVSNVVLTATGYALTVTIAGHSERVVAGSQSSRIGPP